jgi:hypothetical protein
MGLGWDSSGLVSAGARGSLLEAHDRSMAVCKGKEAEHLSSSFFFVVVGCGFIYNPAQYTPRPPPPGGGRLAVEATRIASVV